jgi:hypothetical protein
MARQEEAGFWGILGRMPNFSFDGSPAAVRTDIQTAQAAAWRWLATPGSWWTGAEHVELARIVRAARAQRSEPPWLRKVDPGDAGKLPAAAAEVARRIAIEAHQLDQPWCDAMTVQLGDGAYVEAVAVAAITTAIDAFAESLGAQLEPLPEVLAGEPDRVRAQGVAADGAWVPMTVPFTGPNVARALSLVPGAQMTFFGLVGSMYALADFQTLVWDRPLSRPQIELVAARVSAVNECFY